MPGDKRILLHSCCGPCTVYPLKTLRSGGWSVHALFHNPHIQPYQEFQRRLETLRIFAVRAELPLIIREDYDLEAFFRNVCFRERERCTYCYAVRLETAARLAKKSRFDAFTSTLLYSKRQNHSLIVSIAQGASRKYGIPFHYEDFRVGWKEGQEQAKAMQMYRQQYCGCIYSEKERFAPKIGKGKSQ
ncbi:MAG: epoxyqueuosine reductase QueH [Deltaproteobacteria bacterium]|nr:epoxyqueuosine reductase QueH [Deltaproteobacteria bacterium]